MGTWTTTPERNDRFLSGLTFAALAVAFFIAAQIPTEHGMFGSPDAGLSPEALTELKVVANLEQIGFNILGTLSGVIAFFQFFIGTAGSDQSLRKMRS